MSYLDLSTMFMSQSRLYFSLVVVIVVVGDLFAILLVYIVIYHFPSNSLNFLM